MSYPRDLYINLIALDEGTLDYPELVKLFQFLVDSGLAWSLPGKVGRTARDLIHEGVVQDARTTRFLAIAQDYTHAVDQLNAALDGEV